MYRLIHFSSGEGEYVVLTDELDEDAEEWVLSGYTLSADLRFTPEVPSLWGTLPLGYELHRRD